MTTEVRKDQIKNEAVTLTDTQTLTNKTLTSPKLNEDVALTSTSTELNALDGQMGAWTAYTPTTTQITEGNGTKTADYIQIGKLVWFKFRFILGSTSAITGSPTITLPVTAKTFFATFTGIIGFAGFEDIGVKGYGGFLRLNSTTVAGLLVSGANGLTTAVSSSVPFTFGEGDELTCTGTYEAA